MSNNTPEPWSIDGGIVYFSIIGADGNLIADTGLSSCQGDMALGEINARRIVACVNACRGVDNNQLMVTSVSGAILMLREAEQQRDELLEALNKITSTVHDWSNGDAAYMAGIAKEAIAKINGGSS